MTASSEAHEVLAACTRIRRAAERHMDEHDALGLAWDEEGVTSASAHKGHPQVKVVTFNKVQEGKGVGADYLWWWLDADSDVCFGMLVQAKRLTRSPVRGEMRWTVHLDHKNGQQLRDLLSASTALGVRFHEVAAAEDRKIRFGPSPRLEQGLEDPLPGSTAQKNDECPTCRRMAISMISAYELTAVGSPADNTAMILADGTTLEDLVDHEMPAGVVVDRNVWNIAPGPLRDFLIEEQTGPLEIAKKIFKAVCAQRISAHQMGSAVLMQVAGEALFEEVPEDRGHFPGAYYRHFLQGLRGSWPAYVADLVAAAGEAGDDAQTVTIPPPVELDGVDIDGVVLVTL